MWYGFVLNHIVSYILFTLSSLVQSIEIWADCRLTNVATFILNHTRMHRYLSICCRFRYFNLFMHFRISLFSCYFTLIIHKSHDVISHANRNTNTQTCSLIAQQVNCQMVRMKCERASVFVCDISYDDIHYSVFDHCRVQPVFIWKRFIK